MKNLKLLVWITQCGLSISLPLIVCIWLSVWLHRQQGWGSWVVVVGILLGALLAAEGLRSSLKTMRILAKDAKEDQPPLSFNDHD